MQCYCLFCKTQETSWIVTQLERYQGLKALSPRIIQRKWICGKAFEVSHSMLPGYVFAYVPDGQTPNLRVQGVIRILNDGLPLVENDLAFAERLLRLDGTVGAIKVYREGERLKIAQGLLSGMEGEIVRVDQRQKRLQLKFEFDGIQRMIWLGYDVVE